MMYTQKKLPLTRPKDNEWTKELKHGDIVIIEFKNAYYDEDEARHYHYFYSLMYVNFNFDSRFCVHTKLSKNPCDVNITFYHGDLENKVTWDSYQKVYPYEGKNVAVFRTYDENCQRETIQGAMFTAVCGAMRNMTIDQLHSLVLQVCGSDIEKDIMQIDVRQEPKFNIHHPDYKK